MRIEVDQKFTQLPLNQGNPGSGIGSLLPSIPRQSRHCPERSKSTRRGIAIFQCRLYSGAQVRFAETPLIRTAKPTDIDCIRKMRVGEPIAGLLGIKGEMPFQVFQPVERRSELWIS